MSLFRFTGSGLCSRTVTLVRADSVEAAKASLLRYCQYYTWLIVERVDAA